MNMHFVTLFPEVCKPYFESSILGKALQKKIFSVFYYNPIDTVDSKKRVDDKPYGGGPGMVLRAQPFLDCFSEITKFPGTRKTIFLTPRGSPVSQKEVGEYSKVDNLIFFCGHYEGIDERVAEITEASYISVGDITVTGGELPAMMIADAVLREVTGVLGNKNSLEHTRIAGEKVYTRPKVVTYEGEEYAIPEVLYSGHHKNIDKYRAGKGSKE